MSKLYRRTDAVAYARKYALTPNKAYHEYSTDCTNFVSQALFAGGWPMVGTHNVLDRKEVGQWWYGDSMFTDASYTWAAAQNFHDFLSKSKRATKPIQATDLGLGDIVQIKNSSRVYHSMFVTGKTHNDLLLSYHTGNHLDKPLSAISIGSTEQFIFWKMNDALPKSGSVTFKPRYLGGGAHLGRDGIIRQVGGPKIKSRPNQFRPKS